MTSSFPLPSPASLLVTRFSEKHVNALLNHFSKMINEFQLGHWEAATVISGKFVEATLKATWGHLGNVAPKAKDFKVDSIIRLLEQTPSANTEDCIRLTIPRACRFVYEIASNRGARHDSEEVNPNQMDASAVVATSSWVLGELFRYAQKGAVDLTQATRIVAALSQKDTPRLRKWTGTYIFTSKI